jgi:hypothetical protein
VCPRTCTRWWPGRGGAGRGEAGRGGLNANVAANLQESPKYDAELGFACAGQIYE